VSGFTLVSLIIVGSPRRVESVHDSLPPPPRSASMTAEEVQGWLKVVARRYPRTTRLVELTQTREQRPVLAPEVRSRRVPLRQLRRCAAICRQHGDEPDTSSVGLELIQSLVKLSTLRIWQVTECTAVLVVPVANPDGAWRMSRCNSLGEDLNRDWSAGKTAEVGGLRSKLRGWSPQLVIDIHQWVPRHDGSGSVKFSLEEDLGMQRALAQNFLAQQPDGIYMFNFPCRLAEGANIMHADSATFLRTTSVLREMGSLKTLARKDKHYPFYKELPIYAEANRPRQFHQTIRFAIRGKDMRAATVTLRFRWIAERNPHADGKFRQSSIVKRGLVKVYLNDSEISEAALRKTKAPGGRIPSGFLLKTHEIVEIQVSGRELRDGENTLAFEMPKFPHERDPYVCVYELEADVTFR